MKLSTGIFFGAAGAAVIGLAIYSAGDAALDQFGENSVPANLTGQEYANLFSGSNGTERYYRYMADDKGSVPTDVAFCNAVKGEIPSIRDVASQGAKGMYALATSNDLWRIGAEQIQVNYTNKSCKSAGMTFGFGS